MVHMKHRPVMIPLLTCVVLFIHQVGIAQDKQPAPEQVPVQDRDKGDSLIENIGELPGRLLTLPLQLVIEGFKLIPVQTAYLKMTDFLTNEDGTRKVRPIFNPAGGAGATFSQANLFKPGMTFRARASFSQRTRRSLLADLSDRSFFGRSSGLHLTCIDMRKPDEDFFGIGNTSDTAKSGNYLEEEISLEGTFLLRAGRSTFFGFGMGYSDIAIEDGRDPTRPTLDSVFVAATIPGTAGARMWSAAAKFYHDSRNEAGHPTRGAEYYAAASFSKQISGNDLGFFKYTVDIRRYFELFYRRVLAVRARAEITDDMGLREVPFFRLPGLGGEDLLRGFRPVRFRDDDLAFVSAEYRFPIHGMVSATLFFEEGRVFQNMVKDFVLSDWNYSYGGGFRLRASNGGFITSLILAKSAEETRFLFGLNTEMKAF